MKLQAINSSHRSKRLSVSNGHSPYSRLWGLNLAAPRKLLKIKAYVDHLWFTSRIFFRLKVANVFLVFARRFRSESLLYFMFGDKIAGLYWNFYFRSISKTNLQFAHFKFNDFPSVEPQIIASFDRRSSIWISFPSLWRPHGYRDTMPPFTRVNADRRLGVRRTCKLIPLLCASTKHHQIIFIFCFLVGTAVRWQVLAKIQSICSPRTRRKQTALDVLLQKHGSCQECHNQSARQYCHHQVL